MGSIAGLLRLLSTMLKSSLYIRQAPIFAGAAGLDGGMQQGSLVGENAGIPVQVLLLTAMPSAQTASKYCVILPPQVLVAEPALR